VTRALVVLVALAMFALGGCSTPVETDQARLCRMALPALLPADAHIDVVSQREFVDGRGLSVVFRLLLVDGETTHVADCRFRAPGRPLRSDELIGVAIDGRSLSDANLYFLVRFWLATPEARDADPAPLGDLAGAPRLSRGVAYAVQQALNGLPLAAIYALLAASYSLVYGLVGRINLAFGDLAATGGYAAALGALLAASQPPATILLTAMTLGAASAALWGVATSRWVFAPLSGATGQQALVATVGLALFLGEFLRLAQGNRQTWVSPMFNAPIGLARAPGFIVTTAPDTLLAGGFALVVAAALVGAMRATRFGRRWRAYADDPVAAQLFGVSPRAILAQTFALAGALAGLSGFVMTMYYGSVGYGAATSLGLKALIAAILGGVGSIPGAFLGGFIVGALEAGWQTYFSADYRDVAVFSLLAIILVFRPGGILGVRP
jgi:branched-subunit amino acid ABC-type transport system permease component